MPRSIWFLFLSLVKPHIHAHSTAVAHTHTHTPYHVDLAKLDLCATSGRPLAMRAQPVLKRKHIRATYQSIFGPFNNDSWAHATILLYFVVFFFCFFREKQISVATSMRLSQWMRWLLLLLLLLFSPCASFSMKAQKCCGVWNNCTCRLKQVNVTRVFILHTFFFVLVSVCILFAKIYTIPQRPDKIVKQCCFFLLFFRVVVVLLTRRDAMATIIPVAVALTNLHECVGKKCEIRQRCERAYYNGVMSSHITICRSSSSLLLPVAGGCRCYWPPAKSELSVYTFSYLKIKKHVPYAVYACLCIGIRRIIDILTFCHATSEKKNYFRNGMKQNDQRKHNITFSPNALSCTLAVDHYTVARNGHRWVYSDWSTHLRSNAYCSQGAKNIPFFFSIIFVMDREPQLTLMTMSIHLLVLLCMPSVCVPCVCLWAWICMPWR